MGVSVMSEAGYRFVENPNALELVCHHLHDVQIVGGLARFVPVLIKQARNGPIGMPPLYISLPIQAVEPALMLTWSKLPKGVILPVLGQLARRAVGMH